MTGDINGDGLINNSEVASQTNTNSICPPSGNGNGPSIVITSPNSGGGIGNPFGNSNTVFTPTPVDGTYTMTITPNNCGIPGRVEFTIQSGAVLASSVQYGLAVPATPILGDLSPEVYSIDVLNPGLIFNSTPTSILSACVNSIKVSFGSNQDILLNKSAGENIAVNIPVSITGVVTLSAFRIYDVGNTLLIPPVIDPILLVVGNNSRTWGSGEPPGVYHFEFDVSAGAVSETIKGQFILKP